MVNSENIQDQKQNLPEKGRRNFLKTFATVPVLGAMAYGVYQKVQERRIKSNLGDLFKLEHTEPEFHPINADAKRIGIGIIGYGSRGTMLLEACGFAHPDRLIKLKEAAEINAQDNRYISFMEQEDLQVDIVAVCDVFEINNALAQAAGGNFHRETKVTKAVQSPRVYKDYRDLLADPKVDAVIIATPDHWHGTMAMEAAKRGIHVYLEKPMTWTVPETYLVRKVIKESGIVFQLGHQGRQTDSYTRAKEIVDKGFLGHVSLIQVTTNRNDPNGAWVYDIHPDANPATVDWKQFVPPKERILEFEQYMKANNLSKYMTANAYKEFNPEHFFRWRCWWEYSTGLSGDLLTHEYDAINQIMQLGIPHSATSSGGIYFYKDGRSVPDVLQTTFEFPERDLTLLYSATLASNQQRGKLIMGHDATMDLSDVLTVHVDKDSTRYKEKIEQNIIKPEVPFYTYTPGLDNVDAISSATELYFAKRGLMYSYLNGKRYNTTYLHVREWIQCIRTGAKPSCDIDAAFEEAITAHMGTRAYLEGRTMYWDKDKELIIYG
jgi:predicted dehydrogenase